MSVWRVTECVTGATSGHASAVAGALHGCFKGRARSGVGRAHVWQRQGCEAAVAFQPSR
jgi:hypothetical protein